MFDVHEKENYFVEDNSRSNADKLLENREPVTFLVRNSSTHVGDFALSVRGSEKIFHYRIEAKSERGSTTYVMGNNAFPGIPELLTFYKIHYLDDVPLKYPVFEVEKVSIIEPEPEEIVKLRNAPVLAKVIKEKVPNAYDPNAMRLAVGDLLIVTKRHSSGTWEGYKIGGGTLKEGSFPFHHVQLLDPEEAMDVNIRAFGLTQNSIQ